MSDRCPDPNCNEGIAGPDDQRCATCDGEGWVQATDGGQEDCDDCHASRREEARRFTAPFVDHARTAHAAAETYGDICRWCGHKHDPEDGRCDVHAHVGLGACPCPGEGLAVAYDKINAALYVAEQDCAELRGKIERLEETLRTVRAVCEAKGVDDASKVSVVWGLVALVPGYDADEWEVRRWTDAERYNRRCEAERERRADARNP